MDDVVPVDDFEYYGGDEHLRMSLELLRAIKKPLQINVELCPMHGTK